MRLCLINRLIDNFFHKVNYFRTRYNDTEKLILRVNTRPATIGRGLCVKREHVVKGVNMRTATRALVLCVSDHVPYGPGLSVALAIGSINVGLQLTLSLGFLTIVSKILSIVFLLIKILKHPISTIAGLVAKQQLFCRTPSKITSTLSTIEQNEP